MSQYGEIYVKYDSSAIELFDSLSKEEKILVYLMFRATVPFSRIFRDQNHRHTNAIIDMFKFLYEHQNEIKENSDTNIINDIKTILVYFWVNHGPYFLMEDSDNKRTPERIGLKYLNQNILIDLLKKLNYPLSTEIIQNLFDSSIDSEMKVEGSIDKSGNNYYADNFTQYHYDKLNPEETKNINTYYEVNSNNEINIRTYSTKDKYSDELKVSVFWLKKVLNHISKHSDIFDSHFAKSVELMIQYLETGDEEIFKQHSIEWLKTKNRLDYTLGFIETYLDPMGIRGEAGGEITIKILDMEELNPILLQLEQKLPISKKYMKSREEKNTINVSLNKILFSSGSFGPLVCLAAYCLPNYNDIKTQIGSKQILYKSSDPIEKLLNSELSKSFKTKNRQKFIKKYDLQDKISDDLWDVQVLLHETVGHSSGKFHKHVFEKDENMIISGIKYEIGDKIDVTDCNYSEFIKCDNSSLEELRAEIIALYISLMEIETLDKYKLFKDWVKILGEKRLKKQIIIQMCKHMFRRYVGQGNPICKIEGAHARANVVLTNYLLKRKGIEIEDEIVIIDEEEFHILDIKVLDLEKTINSIITLLKKVQKIKSTGNSKKCQKLFENYTTYPISLAQANIYKNYLQTNKTKIVGNIKAVANLFPNYLPIICENEIVDVKVSDENLDIIEQNIYYDKLILSTDILN